MMVELSDYDRKMIEETEKWLYFGKDDLFHLKNDTPQEIRKHFKKMQELYSMFD